MGDSRAFQLENIVAVLPTSITADEIRESVEKGGRGVITVVKVKLISGVPVDFGVLGRTIYEDVGSPISGRSQGDGMAVFMITVVRNVSKNVDLVAKADRLVQEKAEAIAKREAKVAAREAALTLEKAKKAAEAAEKAAEEARKKLAQLTGEDSE